MRLPALLEAHALQPAFCALSSSSSSSRCVLQPLCQAWPELPPLPHPSTTTTLTAAAAGGSLMSCPPPPSLAWESCGWWRWTALTRQAGCWRAGRTWRVLGLERRGAHTHLAIFPPALMQRFDVWVITAPLSEGCGGPELPEEIIL